MFLKRQLAPQAPLATPHRAKRFRFSNALLIAAAASFPSLGLAQATHWLAETSVGKPQDGSTGNTYQLKATRFLQPFAYDRLSPYEETPFTRRIGSIQFSYSKSDNSASYSLLASGNPIFSIIQNAEANRSHDAYGFVATIQSSKSPHSFTISHGRSRDTSWTDSSFDINFTELAYQQHSELVTAFEAPTIDGSSSGHRAEAHLDALKRTLIPNVEFFHDGLSIARNEDYHSEIEYNHYLSKNWSIGPALHHSKTKLSGRGENDRFNLFNAEGIIQYHTVTLQSQGLWRIAETQWLSLLGRVSRSQIKARIDSLITIGYSEENGTQIREKRQSYQLDQWHYLFVASYYWGQKTGLNAAYEVDVANQAQIASLGISRHLSDYLRVEVTVSKHQLDDPLSLDLTALEEPPTNFNSYEAQLGIRF